MGLPNVTVSFRTQGTAAVTRSEKGVVAVILEDSKALGGHELTSVTQIPAELGQENKQYVQRAFTGYVTPPRLVKLYVMDPEEEELKDALAYFETQQFDYLAGPPDLNTEDAQAIAAWVKSERLNDHMVKAVLPNTAADSEAIVNLTADGIKAGETEYTTAQFCSRIAGLIAGTPMTISCTYAPLPELSDVERHTRAELDAAVDKGEFVLFHDGEKVKAGRGVTSFVTATAEKGNAFRKLKVVEAMDMIKADIRMTAQDSYIGKYANSYDNKCLLLMAIKGYLEELERAGILESGTSVVELDMEAQEAYLQKQGIDTSSWNEQTIRKASTGSHVFLKASIQILDAIEDITLDITI